jgi:2-dehydro-3-deoxygalactonokinase
MKHIGVIDCGTTNSRLSIVTPDGAVQAQTCQKIGVKDTAIQGSNEPLKRGLTSLFEQAAKQSGIDARDISPVVSSGMITSELGLLEIPHLVAPAGIDDFASSLTRLEPSKGLAIPSDLYLIRGVKNKPNPPKGAPIASVRGLDFMRGEETQVMGLLEIEGRGAPTTVVNLSSHTKYISVDAEGRIRGAITTLSGQVYESLVQGTFIGKSIAEPAGAAADRAAGATAHLEADLEEVTHLASTLVKEVGLLRALLVPRFMDTLMTTDWRIRKRFVDACLVADDLRAQRLFPEYGFQKGERVYLIGLESRCEVFKSLFRETELGKGVAISIISDTEYVRRLAIEGALAICRKAGLV